MLTRRALLLLGILIALAGVYAFRDALNRHAASAPATLLPEPPLPGQNSISGVTARQNKDRDWTVEFDYFYTGEPRVAALHVAALPQPRQLGRPEGDVGMENFVFRLSRGKHHTSLPVPYPGDAGTTTKLQVSIRTWQGVVSALATQQIDQVIDWPTAQTWRLDQQIAHASAAENLRQTSLAIDSGDTSLLPDAKLMLEKLIERNPGFDDAYVELARVAMKSNWNPEGLHQAAAFLASALRIRPDNINAKILLGYVYAHQDQYARAEAIFAEVAPKDPPNLWLWTNWGELLAMQGKFKEAEAKYREAITRPMPHDAYDRARASAYVSLLKLVERRKDDDALETLYKQRIAEFGPGACYSTDYGRFLLDTRGDPKAASDVARRALKQKCDDRPARVILGMSQYVLWASATGPERDEALNQARIYLPPGANCLYQLATSGRTGGALRQLLATGEKLDAPDGEQMTALALALQNQDLAAARRLLALGARTNVPVGPAAIPVALLPVVSGDLAAVKLLRRAGTDYGQIRYQGATALDYAKQTGNTALLEILSKQSVSM